MTQPRTRRASASQARATRKRTSPSDNRADATTADVGNSRVIPRRGLVEQQIYEQATRLFAERGFAGTNLQDIADAVGLTRPALYYYVRSKDELLARLVTAITQDAATHIRAIARRTDLDAAQKVYEVVRTNALRQGKNSAPFQLLIRSEANLPDTIAATHVEGRRAVLQWLTGIVEEGIKAGTFRPVDSRVAALGLLGMTNWVAWWFNADHGDDLDAICQQLGDFAVAGLTLGSENRGPVDSPSAAIKMIRADLLRLESMVSHPPKADDELSHGPRREAH